MKFSIDRQVLLDRLRVVNKAIAPNSPLSETGGALFEVNPDVLVLTATDNKLTIQSSVYPGELSRLQVMDTGREIIDSKMLAELLARLDDATIELETVPGKVMRVISRDGDFNVKSVNPEKWPLLDLTTPDNRFMVSKAMLTDVVDEISHAAGIPEKTSRTILTGIHLDIRDHKLEAAATDAFRMARKEADVESEAEVSFTVPAKYFKDFVRSITGEEDQVEVALSRKMVQFIYEKTIFQFQLLEGAYPAIRQIIPAEEKFIGKLLISASELKGVLERAQLYNRYLENSCVRMSLNSREVKIVTRTQEIGSSEQIFNTAGYEGDDLALTFNYSYMLDAVNGLKGADQIQIQFTGPLSPMKVTNPEDDSVLMILVPVRDYQ